VPDAWLAKSNVSVSQAPATVVRVSVSTDCPGLAEFSAFRRIGIPASGDQTRAVIVVAVAVNGMTGTAWLARVDTVVPAQTCAPASLTTRATLFEALVGSATTDDWLSPKSVRVGGVASSKEMTKPPGGVTVVS